MPDFKNMIKGMEEKETPEAPTQEETEKAGKLADSGFKIGEHRFIAKDNNKANPGFIAYGGNNPDQKLSTKELAKIYDEQQKAKSVSPEQDRLTKLKKDAIAESQATAQKEAPLAQNPGESGNPKELLSQMEGIRNEEKQKESDLLRKWAVDKSISYDEFKNEEKKLHQEAQDRVDSLYGTLTTALNKAPSADKPKKASWEDPNKRVKEADAKYKPIYDKMEKEDDEIYKAYWYETDPKKKAELKAQLEEHGKKIDALIEEWEQAAGFGKESNTEQGVEQDEDSKNINEELDDFAEYIDNYLGYDGYTATKNPDGTYSTNIGQEDPDAEPVQLTPAEFESLYRKMVSEEPTMKGDFANYRKGLSKTNGSNAPRLLKPTDDFTDAEIKNFLDYLFYTNVDQGYTYEKTPQGDYYTNLVAGDPEAEPVVVNEEQLKGFLRNSLQNVDNLAQNLYEWQIDNQ